MTGGAKRGLVATGARVRKVWRARFAHAIGAALSQVMTAIDGNGRLFMQAVVQGVACSPSAEHEEVVHLDLGGQPICLVNRTLVCCH